MLLILAGVSIATLTGPNGLLTRAQEAKEETKLAEQEEKKDLDATEDLVNQYVGIDWDSALENATKHPDQVTSTAIGVGTDGKTVNMDLWEYTLLEDGTYALNDEKSITEEKITSGYLGKIINGEIEGSIPQYIKDESDIEFVAVTNIIGTFINLDSLVNSPQIPTTVTNMFTTFGFCSSLKNAPVIPNNVNNMRQTFQMCTNLIQAPEIPDKVEDMHFCFYHCITLEKAPSLIPESVKVIDRAFYECYKLNGTIKLNADIKTDSHANYEWCFWDAATENGAHVILEGKCPALENILSQIGENSNISINSY